MSDDELRGTLKSIQEALDALVMIQEQEAPSSRDAQYMATLLELKAHEQVASSLLDLAKMSGAAQLQAFADEYRRVISSIWCQPDGQSESGVGWGLFNPKAAAAQRPVLITRVRNLLRGGIQLWQERFERPLTTQLLLIDTLFSFFKLCGFARSDIPLIAEQYGDPPLFRKLRGKPASRASQQDCPPPYELHLSDDMQISIEELLGVYVARNEQITLFADGIRWCAAELGVQEPDLRFVVLVHEIAHWAIHRLPTTDSPEFRLAQYEKSEDLFHETLAQLLTHWVSVCISGSFKDVFDKLNARQSSTYRAYQSYEKINPVAVVATIVDARKRDVPSTSAHLAADISRHEAERGRS